MFVDVIMAVVAPLLTGSSYHSPTIRTDDILVRQGFLYYFYYNEIQDVLKRFARKKRKPPTLLGDIFST